jgi:hypothetical protein
MKNYLLVILCAFMALLAAGCGGKDVPYVPIVSGPGTPDFNVSVQQITPTPVFTETGSEAIRTAGKVRPAEALGTATFTVTVTPLHGFTGTVSLGQAIQQDSGGFSASFSPTQVTLDGVDSQTSSFTVALSSTVSAGNYSWSITGTSGTLSHTATTKPTVTVQAPKPDFTVSVQQITPTPIFDDNEEAKVRPFGDSNTATFTVTVAPVNGFTGTVSLSGLVQGEVSGFSTSFSPTQVTLDGVHSQTSGFTVALTSNEASGNYSWAITGKSGALSHTATTQPTVTVQGGTPSYNLSLYPQETQTIYSNNGGSAEWIITVQSENLFTGPVTFTVTNPNNAYFSTGFTATTVTVAAGGSQSTQLTVTLGSGGNNVLGNNTFVVTAKSGSLSATETVIADVMPESEDLRKRG